MVIKRLFCVVVVLLLISCNDRGKVTVINFFNGVTFKMKRAERLVAATDKFVLSNYQNYLTKGFEIPLYKVIRAKDYTIFLGIPYNPINLKSYSVLRKDSIDSFESKFLDSISVYKSYTKGKDFCAEIMCKDSINGRGMFVLAQTRNIETFNAQFVLDSLTKRISIDEKK